MTNTTKPLIEAALSHLAIERAAACAVKIPGTDPQLYVAVGPLEGLRHVLEIAGPSATPARAAASSDVEHDLSEGGHHD